MKNKKLIYILLIVAVLLFTHTVNVYAATTDTIISGADTFLEGGNTPILNNNVIKKVSDNVFNVFFSIGTIIVVIIGAILGIKFMAGSVEEKADIKESIKPYVLGAIVIFASIAIWSISVTIFQDVF